MREDELTNSDMDEEDAFTKTLLPATDSDVPSIETLETKPALASANAGKQPPWAGKLMGHFKLMRLIGQGTMGFVIQAEDIHLKRIVALKVLRKQLSGSQKRKEAVDQFLREARAAAAVEHPNIVRVYEINQHAGWWFIAMEMVTGNSLQTIIKAAGFLPPSRACPIIADAATGLQAAHELGIIHRDIKPGNILVTRSGHGKVSDFGLVRIDDPADPFDIFANRSVGTPYYIAPEMIRRENITAAADIYCLGATLYHILTGKPPFTGKKSQDILDQHLNAEPPSLLEVQHLANCPQSLNFLVRRMMDKDPQARPSAAEVEAILRAEAIAAPQDNPAASGMLDPMAMTPLAGTARQASACDSTVDLTHAASRTITFTLPKTRTLTISVLAIFLAAAIGLPLWLYMTHVPSGQDRQALAGLFPNSPTSYGLPTRDPVAAWPDEIPSFSWAGKFDISGVQFVAARSGRFYYPVQDRRALLIRADQFVPYATAEQAQQDGKEPAPPSE